MTMHPEDRTAFQDEAEELIKRWSFLVVSGTERAQMIKDIAQALDDMCDAGYDEGAADKEAEIGDNEADDQDGPIDPEP